MLFRKNTYEEDNFLSKGSRKTSCFIKSELIHRFAYGIILLKTLIL